MHQEHIESFHLIGITVRTNNISGAAAKDIPALWQKFFEEQTGNKIPNKTGDELYCVYTDYEGDYTQDYTTLLGCRTSSLQDIPEGMQGLMIPAGSYTRFEAEGKMEEGFVYQKWTEIWQSDLDRAYTSDFEVYDFSNQNNEKMVMNIFIALK